MKDKYGFDLEQSSAVEDNPFWDATDFAHPAWWRGNDYAASMMTQQLKSVLGVEGDHTWHELLKMVKKLNK